MKGRDDINIVHLNPAVPLPNDHGAKKRRGNGSARGPVTLADAHAVFRKWFGPNFDLDTADAVLAAAAVERLLGDPLWLLVISGPGNAKTQTVQSLAGAGATVTSTISSEGALLSATPKKGT